MKFLQQESPYCTNNSIIFVDLITSDVSIFTGKYVISFSSHIFKYYFIILQF
jgi:hypothetical protein